MSPISNASSFALSLNSGTLPDVSETLYNYFQFMTFTQVVKSTVNFKVVETPTSTSFQGVWQPLNTQQLFMKPEGQRSWKWFTLHAQLGLILSIDDVVTYLGTQYRVMGKSDYSLYGYIEYHLIEDYTGAGP